MEKKIEDEMFAGLIVVYRAWGFTIARVNFTASQEGQYFGYRTENPFEQLPNLNL